MTARLDTWWEYVNGDRCEHMHKKCAWCDGCLCDDGSRVSTDRKGRTLCAACRAIDNHHSDA